MSPDLVHHGVEYTVSSEPPKAHLPVDEFRLRGIKYVRIQWVDLVNHIKHRVVPITYFEKLLQTSRPGSSLTRATLGLVFVTVAEGFSSTGECLYALDLSTLRLCPYAPGHASVMGWFEEKQPRAGLSGHRALEMDICPRTILRRVVENAKELSGIEFLIGFETEFILLNKISPVEAVNPHGWCDSKALLSGSTEAVVLEEIADCLAASGVELQMYHGEGAPGQYEIVTGPLAPPQAVDALIHTRETIYNVANKHGLTATLAPRIFLDNCGSATHAHISVHAPSNETPEPSLHANLTTLEEHLLAGILAHLSSLTLLLMPTSASYARMHDGVWSGGTYVCWGTDDKEAPLRLCNAASPSSRNFELKTLDGTANPYLAIAGVLSAGLEGVLEERALTIKDCHGEKSAALLGDKGRADLGITERLPLSWEEARVKFEQSRWVDNVFGKEFKTKYLSVNKLLKELSTGGRTEEEALRLLVENY